MTLICGIDEAGRGPCIGSMFIVGTLFEKKDIEKLKKEGIKDSKLLTHKKRVLLEKKIKKIAKKIKIIKVEPPEIDKAVNKEDNLNLNWLEAQKTVEILNELHPDKAIIDCPSPNIRKYENYLRLRLKKQMELVVTHKADLKFVEVAAASIIAKVERENEVSKLKKKYGNFGPGYTSNEITQKFIKENWEKYPEIFRKSWSTWQNHKKAKAQKKLGDF